VELVALGGVGQVHGLNGLTNGATSGEAKPNAIARAQERGFLPVADEESQP
jgi:hypothetical protein